VLSSDRSIFATNEWYVWYDSLHHGLLNHVSEKINGCCSYICKTTARWVSKEKGILSPRAISRIRLLQDGILQHHPTHLMSNVHPIPIQFPSTSLISERTVAPSLRAVGLMSGLNEKILHHACKMQGKTCSIGKLQTNFYQLPATFAWSSLIWSSHHISSLSSHSFLVILLDLTR